MANKRTIKLADLANIARPVDISEEEQILVRALTLDDVIVLFTDSRDLFLALYETGMKDNPVPEDFTPFLISSPGLVAQIIAMAMDEPEGIPMIRKRLPATVQLVALVEIWKASVPDPKKARELLSEVTALLQELEDKQKKTQELQQTSSPMTSPPE